MSRGSILTKSMGAFEEELSGEGAGGRVGHSKGEGRGGAG